MGKWWVNVSEPTNVFCQHGIHLESNCPKCDDSIWASVGHGSKPVNCAPPPMCPACHEPFSIGMQHAAGCQFGVGGKPLDLKAIEEWTAETREMGRGLNREPMHVAVEHLEALLTALRETREALAKLEWGKEKAGWTGRIACCPACYGPERQRFLGHEDELGKPQYEPAGHKPNCWLATVLAQVRDE